MLHSNSTFRFCFLFTQNPLNTLNLLPSFACFFMKEETTEDISFLCSFPGYFNFAVNYVNAQALLETVKACE